MVSSLSALRSVSQNALTDPFKNKTAIKQAAASSSTRGVEDQVNISGDRNLSALQVEAGNLQNDLPGLIADSLLAPGTQSAQQQLPINALLGQLVTPATLLLQKTSVDDFSRDQLAAFQSEVESLRQSIPQLVSNELLSPFVTSLGPTDSLNGILKRISGELTGLADLVLEKTR